jgi:hypothetical protein
MGRTSTIISFAHLRIAAAHDTVGATPNIDYERACTKEIGSWRDASAVAATDARLKQAMHPENYERRRDGLDPSLGI